MKPLFSEDNIIFLRRCLLLFFAYLFFGFLLQFYQVSRIIWIFTYLSIFYLSWSGTGAIALVLFFSFMIVGLSFFYIDPGTWFQKFLVLQDLEWYKSLSAQFISLHTIYFKPTLVVILWIVMFLFLWIIGIGITFYHGFTQVFIEAEAEVETRITVFLLLSFMAILGIQLGTLFVQ
jgi:hypothetical protein